MKCSQDAGYEAPLFGGLGVRIRAHWTKPVWSMPDVYWDSWEEIRFADEMLRRETLSLDVEPALIEVPPILPAPFLSRPVERRVERLPAPPKRPLPSAFLDFDETLDLTNDKNLTEDSLRPVRSLIDRALR
jgi:hypothetical protein